MKIIITENTEELNERANSIIFDIVQQNPRAVLGLATGSSPLGLYAAMVRDFKAGLLSYADVRTVNLDEYVGLPVTHPESYRNFMERNLFSHLDLANGATEVPNGNAADLNEECKRYDAVLDARPRDIQLLGLGANGHVGFNEPGTPFSSRTHVVELKEKTRRDNARFFDSIDQVPTHAVTMGIADILAAKSILLVAMGTNKADAVAAMVRGERTEACPASALQTHPDVTVLLDKAAASKLN